MTEAITTCLMNDSSELALETVPRRIWINCKQAEETFGIPASTLRRLAKSGACRSCKTGEGRKSPRVYNVSDLHEWMCARAEEEKNDD